MSTFEERLQQFLQMENLTPAKLADTMGVQRGGLSHLLSGRNKPSFDFITRLLELYPDLNFDWLLLGKGKPFKNDSTQPAIQNQPIEPHSSIFPEFSFEPERKELPTETKEITEEIPIPEPLENRVSYSRTITRLTIFYSDGTYEER